MPARTVNEAEAGPLARLRSCSLRRPRRCAAPAWLARGGAAVSSGRPVPATAAVLPVRLADEQHAAAP